MESTDPGVRFDPANLDPHGEVEVWAAGGIVERGSEAPIEILLVHRPDRRDWSLPKGKLDPGETLLDAARREIAEETGFSCEMGPPIASVRYLDARRRSKAVVYFRARVTAGGFTPNDEVDEIRWCRPLEAVALLTYPHDARMLAEVVRMGPPED